MMYGALWRQTIWWTLTHPWRLFTHFWNLVDWLIGIRALWYWALARPGKQYWYIDDNGVHMRLWFRYRITEHGETFNEHFAVLEDDHGRVVRMNKYDFVVRTCPVPRDQQISGGGDLKCETSSGS